MNPHHKRFIKKYAAIYDGIASVDILQLDREKIALEVGRRLAETGDPDFKHQTFVLLATDPLVPCAGIDDEPCEHGRIIRIGMHLGIADLIAGTGDGRSMAWRPRRPEIRCVSCGFEQREKSA